MGEGTVLWQDTKRAQIVSTCSFASSRNVIEKGVTQKLKVKISESCPPRFTSGI